MMSHRELFHIALDPSRVLAGQRMAPDPWQRRLLVDPGRQVLLNCSRQTGKSRTVAALAVHTALFRPGSLTLLVSPSLRQSTELFRKVLDGYQALGRPVAARSANQTRLELVNHSRVLCLPGREDTIRSFGGVTLLAIDEAARVPDDLYRAVRPMLAVSQGRLICLSTPFGRRGFFYREWERGGEDWQRVRVPWNDCPRITPAFIDQERHSLGDSWIRQEYECSFEAMEGLVYPAFEVQCGLDTVPAVEPTVGGIDFGYRNPFAALWGHTDGDGVLWITGERYASKQTIHEHSSHLPRKVTWYADPAGAEEIAALRQFGFAVRKGTNEIQSGIAAVRARLETGKLKVLRAACPNLFAEASQYRYPSAADGETASETPVDECNHALAALRYLVARLDHAFIRMYRRKLTAESASAQRGGPRKP